MSGKTVKVNLKIRRETADSIRRLCETLPWLAFGSLEDFFEEAGRRYIERLLVIEGAERK